MSRRRVPSDALDESDDTLTLLDGERFTGIAEDRFADGGIRFETEYRNGILDGTSRTYWPSGDVRQETWYDYGIRLRQRSWHESGTAREDAVFDEHGLKHHYKWAEDGSAVDTYHRAGS